MATRNQQPALTVSVGPSSQATPQRVIDARNRLLAQTAEQIWEDNKPKEKGQESMGSAFHKWEIGEDGTSFTGVRQTEEKLPPGLYEVFEDDYGRPVATKVTERLDETWVFSNGPMPKLLEEVAKFWSSNDKYKQFGFTHKRGILTFGPPGNGKTSAISAVVKQVEKLGGIAVFARDGRRMSMFRDFIKHFRSFEPDREVVLVLEDFDNACSQYEELVLEMLDGTTSLGHKILVVATTNNLEKVPDRIKDRPSRIDTLIEFPLPDSAQRSEYLKYLLSHKTENSDLVGHAWFEAIASETEGFSLAHLKELVISVEVYGKDVNETIKLLSPKEEKKES